MLLWRVSWGRISSKPIKCIELGNGILKVVGSCLTKQDRDGRYESFHETHKSAVLRVLTDAERDVETAEKNLKNTKRRLVSLKSKWADYTI